MVRNPDSYYSLGFKHPNYFKTIDRQPPEEKGWYIILHDGKAIYVGIADNLNSRLNSDNGSRDNFGNPKRSPNELTDLDRKNIEKLIDVFRAYFDYL